MASTTTTATKMKTITIATKTPATKRKNEKPTGIPPWHSIAYIGVLSSVATFFLPSKESLDALATVDAFTNRIFPKLITVKQLGYMRLSLAICCWFALLKMVFYDDGWLLYTNYRSESKLKNKYFTLRRLTTMCPFTSWSYLLLSLHFLFSAIIPIQTELGLGGKLQPWFFRAAIIFWETSAPLALLVSAVVRYAIWPVVLDGGEPHTLANFKNQMMHNLNSIFALMELALLGGPPMSFSHVSLSCTIGVIYIIFTWTACWWYGKPSDGPQYIYWFMDTTLEAKTTIAIICLTATLAVSFGIFLGIEAFIKWIGGTVLINMVVVVVVSSLVCRTS